MAPRTPLLHPNRYFSNRHASLARALGVVAVLTALTVVAVFVLGWIFTARVDGTVMVDNPARPSDAFCSNDFFDGNGCDQPRKVERDIDSIFNSAISKVAGQMVWGIPFAWLLFGLLLHAASWLADGENGASASFTVAAWGLVPSVVSMAIGLGVLYLTFDPITVTPADDPEMLREQVVGELGALRTAGTVLGVATAVWSGIIWRFGLEHARRLSAEAATAVAAVGTLLTMLVSVT